MRSHQLLSTRRWLKSLAAAALGLAPLANLGTNENASAQDRVYRSVADLRERIPDEHHRPRYKERWTHRGFEVVSDQITVVATTSIDDARRAAGEATRAWQEVGELADQFTRVHRNRDFGIGALQVQIDGEPQRDRDQPLTTLNVVGQKSQVVIHVNPGQPTLDQQSPRLREATVLAFLRTAELDLQYPAWVCEGIAGYLAEKGETTEALERVQPKPTTANIGGAQWRSIRQQQDVLTPVANEHSEAVARVRFLLEGDDSAHTPAFFAMLQASAQDVAQRRAGENLVKSRRGEVQPSLAGPQGDHLFVSLNQEYISWQKEPLAGQPVYRPAKDVSPEMEQLQREMTLVLKLQRRFVGSTKASARTKVVSFKKEPTFVGGNAKVMLGVADPRDVFFDLTSGEQGPWATRDVDGSLLLSSNVERLKDLFGDDGRRFNRLRHSDRWVLSTKLGNGRVMAAWLEDNKEIPSRPEVKFEVIDPNKPTPAQPAEVALPQAELGPPVIAPQPAASAPPGNEPVGESRPEAVQPNE